MKTKLLSRNTYFWGGLEEQVIKCKYVSKNKVNSRGLKVMLIFFVFLHNTIHYVYLFSPTHPHTHTHQHPLQKKFTQTSPGPTAKLQKNKHTISFLCFFVYVEDVCSYVGNQLLSYSTDLCFSILCVSLGSEKPFLCIVCMI